MKIKLARMERIIGVQPIEGGAGWMIVVHIQDVGNGAYRPVTIHMRDFSKEMRTLQMRALFKVTAAANEAIEWAVEQITERDESWKCPKK